jgi:hypothetical protein
MVVIVGFGRAVETAVVPELAVSLPLLELSETGPLGFGPTVLTTTVYDLLAALAAVY